MIKQSDPHKRGRASRTKGKNAELELVHILRDFYGYPVRRGKVFYHESDVVGLPGIHIEVKRREPMALRDAMVQAVREARIRKDGAPTVFARAGLEAVDRLQSLQRSGTDGTAACVHAGG